MDTSIRASSGIGIALLFGAIAAFGSGCTPAANSAAPLAPTGLGFAITSSPSAGPTMRVHQTRILTSKVNLQEPVLLAAQGSDITVTAAMRGHRGWTFTMDPQVLAPTSVTPYDYEDHPQRPHPGCQEKDGTRLKLRDNRTVAFWTDESTNVVVAQIFDADGTAYGPESTASGPTGDVVGAPRAVTSDGQHVVIAYFTATDTGFELVATSLEAP
jgi:hypothetical protein